MIPTNSRLYFDYAVYHKLVKIPDKRLRQFATVAFFNVIFREKEGENDRLTDDNMQIYLSWCINRKTVEPQ